MGLGFWLSFPSVIYICIYRRLLTSPTLLPPTPSLDFLCFTSTSPSGGGGGRWKLKTNTLILLRESAPSVSGPTLPSLFPSLLILPPLREVIAVVAMILILCISSPTPIPPHLLPIPLTCFNKTAPRRMRTWPIAWFSWLKVNHGRSPRWKTEVEVWQPRPLPLQRRVSTPMSARLATGLSRRSRRWEGTGRVTRSPRRSWRRKKFSGFWRRKNRSWSLSHYNWAAELLTAAAASQGSTSAPSAGRSSRRGRPWEGTWGGTEPPSPSPPPTQPSP